MTTTTTQELTELAQAVLTSKLGRAVIVGATKSGRTITEMTGTPSAAEQRWSELHAASRAGTLTVL